jgi:hypothetical protein
MFKYISNFFTSLSAAPSTDPASTGAPINIDFNPMNFVNNLTYLAKGLIGIFIVIGIIMLITVILNKLPSGKNKKDE